MTPVLGRLRPVLLAAALAGGAAGCHGGAAGPVARAATKDTDPEPEPKGRVAGFWPFPGRAARLEVSPARADNPVGAKQLLVATVFDPDGKPRRRQRVEWAVDGPGEIAAADDGPVSARRAGGKTAVTSTGTFSHPAPDPSDDLTVRPGQTWVVVTSAVEGQTTVTARSPDVADPGRRSAAVRLTWADAQFTFPKGVVAPPGGEAELLTAVRGLPGKGSADGLKVRYRVAGGAPAVLAGRSGGKTEAEVTAGPDGEAAVRLTQPNPTAGTTTVVVEVVKPDKAGGPEAVVGRKEVGVEWAAANLTLAAAAPKAAGVGREVVVTFTVANGGKAGSQPVTLRADLPAGVEVVSADPPPANKTDRRLTWEVGAVPAGGKEAVTLTLRPGKKGVVAVAASAETPDGQAADHRAEIEVDEAGLTVAAEVPARAGVGDRVPVGVAVTNPGAVPAENVTAWVGFGPGLAHDGGAAQAEVPVGPVGPGRTKRVEVLLTAKDAGRAAVRVTATADGGLSARADPAAVEVRRAGLAVAVDGPPTVAVGQDDEWVVRVTNTGDVPVPGAVARVTLPAGLSAKAAADGGRVHGADAAEWRLGELAPGAKKAVKLTARADRPAAGGAVTAAAFGGGPGAAGKLEARAEAPVAVAGRPALVVDLADVPGAVPVGRRAAVRVTVRNRGTGPAKGVAVSATVSEAFGVAGATGADRKPGKVAGRAVTFGPLAELPAGKVAVYVVELEAAKPGPARVTAEARADNLPDPVEEEQAARVVGKPAPEPPGEPRGGRP